MSRKKKKTYIVPIVQHMSFGAEVTVEATSKEEAIELAKQGKFDNGDGWDWDRCAEGEVEIGDWQDVEEEDEE